MDVPRILLAADDPDFALLIQIGFQESSIFNPLHVVKDGREAISYLDGEGQYADRIAFPLPTLMLIDARLRQATGFEVIQWIHQQPALGGISVVLFSNLGTESDARLAEEVGVDYYLVKPFDFQELVEIVQRIGVSWLQAASFPQMPLVPAGIGRDLRSPKQRP